LSHRFSYRPKPGYHRAWLCAVLAIDGCLVAERGPAAVERSATSRSGRCVVPWAAKYKCRHYLRPRRTTLGVIGGGAALIYHIFFERQSPVAATRLPSRVGHGANFRVAAMPMKPGRGEYWQVGSSWTPSRWRLLRPGTCRKHRVPALMTRRWPRLRYPALVARNARSRR
jgi:hypothetical protein